jgi:hypothetical protein
MKEIVLLGSWTNTPEREETLIETILKWKKHDIPIALGTHFPVSRKIQNMIDYYVFDKNNYPDPTITMYDWYRWNNLKITMPWPKLFYAHSMIISSSNTMKIIYNKCDFIYYQEFDVNLNIEETLNIVRKIRTPEKKLYMFNWLSQANQYATNVYFFYKEGFYELWKNMETSDDYKNLVNQNGNVIMPEYLCKNIIDTQKINIHLFDSSTTEILINDFTIHDSARELEPRIALSSTTNNNVILFLVNELEYPVTYEIQETNKITGELTSTSQKINGNLGIYYKIYDNNTYLKISCNNIKKEYDINPGTIFSECLFEFFDGTNLYPIKDTWW